MASDGPAAWTLKFPRRDDVLRRMVAAIDRWDLQTQRNINYRYLSESVCLNNNLGKKCFIHNTLLCSFCRSFEPILYLTKVYHTPECQHWAVWALANLTKVYRKY
jgi:Zyg-11 family protein